MDEKKAPITKKVLNDYKELIHKEPSAVKDLIDKLENGSITLSDELRKEIVRENKDKMAKAIDKLPASKKRLYKMINEQTPIKVKVKIDKSNNTREIIF